MKCCLKTTDEFSLRQKTPHNGNGIQICPVMQGSKAQPILHALQDLIVQLMNAIVPFREGSLIANTFNLSDSRNNPQFFSCQIIQEHTYPTLIVGNMHLF